MKSAIVVIDNEAGFLSRCERVFADAGVLADFRFVAVEAAGEDAPAALNAAIANIEKLGDDYGVPSIFLIDIVLDSATKYPLDKSGLHLATWISQRFPHTPVVALTRFVKNYRLLTAVSLHPNIHGILPKDFVETPGFVRKDLLDVIESARAKISSDVAAAAVVRTPTTRGRPRIFIGSSREGLEIANHLQVPLQREYEVSVWSQGVFDLSITTIETLVGAAKGFDFAILVVTPDDTREMRGASSSVPRDNVIFELGLYMGAIGRERTFVVKPMHQSIALPSDLLGLTCAEYDDNRSDGNWSSAVGGASTQLLDAMKKLSR